MEFKYWLLAVVLVGAAAICDLAAHRDEVVSRRIRELNPETVQSELDRIRNRRWHNLGAAQRAVSAVLLAAVLGAWTRDWIVFGLSAWTGGWLTCLLFDIDFNIRLRLPWDYLGTTSVLDQKAKGGKLAALKELGLVLAGIIAWHFIL